MNASVPLVRTTLAESWPQGVSHEPSLKIGDVVRTLKEEFPLLRPSKLRHFEAEKLVVPFRSASRQRLYSPADVERLRFVLRVQRDRYLPLSQIREMLAQLDEGHAVDEQEASTLRLVREEDITHVDPGKRVKIADVAEHTGVSVGQIEELIDAGILTADARGRLSAHASDVVVYAQMLLKSGYELRHVRSLCHSARSHAVMVSQNLATEQAKKTVVAGERVVRRASEDASVISELYRALLTESIDIELR